MNPLESEDDAPLWKALADPRRRLIIDLLREKPRTTGELCRLFGDVSRFAIMKHLSILQAAGLLTVQREGRERWNLLNQEQLEQIWPRPIRQTNSQLHAFQIQEAIYLHASRQRVFQALTYAIDGWWPERVAAGVIHLEPVVGGRFFESFNGANAGVLLAIVTYIEPEKELRFSGPMAIAAEALFSVTAILLESEGEMTYLEASQRLYGEVSEQLIDRYVTRWHQRHQALKAFVEVRNER